MAAKKYLLGLFWYMAAISLISSICAIPMHPKNNVNQIVPFRVKRQGIFQPDTGAKTPVEVFLSKIMMNRLDLIVLIERSWFVGRQWFYLETRKFVRHVLRYYTTIGKDNVRVAIVSFAEDVTVHVNGIQQPNVSKCNILGEYWKNVVLDDRENIWRRAHIRLALEKARDLFPTSGSANIAEPNAEKYIWLLTSGEFEVTDNIEELVGELHNMGVIILATKTGHTAGNRDNICKVAKFCENYGGDISDWSEVLEETTIEQSGSAHLLYHNTSCDCDQTTGFFVCDMCSDPNCGSNNMCSTDCICHDSVLCPKHNTWNVCPFLSGQTGRYCDQKEVECVPGTCAAGLECVEKTGTYDCKCECSPGLYTICHPDGGTEIEPCPILGPVVGGSVGGFILILAIVIGACWWRKKKAPTKEMGTNTQSTGTGIHKSIRGWFTARYQKRQKNPRRRSSDDASNQATIGTGTAEIGTYISIGAPSLPDSLPAPTLRRILPVKQNHRAPIPTILKGLPAHHHPVGGIEEITRRPYTIKEYERPVTAASQGSAYENSESKDMPGWDAYLRDLAEKGNFRNVAIVRYDLQAYVTTCSIALLPRKDELQNIYDILLSKRTKAQIKLKGSRYSVTRNDGKMIESWLEGRTPDVLCIGRSKNFLVLAVQTDRKRTGECYEEVKWVRQHLSKQNK